MASVRGRRGNGPVGVPRASRRGASMRVMDPVRKTDDADCPRIAEKRGRTLGVKVAERSGTFINVGENSIKHD